MMSPEVKLHYLGRYMLTRIEGYPLFRMSFDNWLVRTLCEEERLRERRRRKMAARSTVIIMHPVEQCFYCETLLTQENRSVDHVIPYIMGGRNSMENKVMACKNCNAWKSGFLLQEWTQRIRLELLKPHPRRGYTPEQFSLMIDKCTLLKNQLECYSKAQLYYDVKFAI